MNQDEGKKGGLEEGARQRALTQFSSRRSRARTVSVNLPPSG